MELSFLQGDDSENSSVSLKTPKLKDNLIIIMSTVNIWNKNFSIFELEVRTDQCILNFRSRFFKYQIAYDLKISTAD